MKVIINNAEMVPTPKKGTIIRFGDWWVVAVPDGGLYVTDGDEPIVTGVAAGVEMITSFFGPRL